jgi:cytidyltransferase-like protein
MCSLEVGYFVIDRSEPRLTSRWWGPPPRREGVGPLIVTGVFDILHVGHIRFLTWAAGRGRPLYVGLEDDLRVRAFKGSTRPINSLSDRAEVVMALRAVTAVFVISGPPEVISVQDYVDLLTPKRTAALAFTAGDPHAEAKRAGAAALNADVWEFPFEIGYSSSNVIEQIMSGRGQKESESRVKAYPVRRVPQAESSASNRRNAARIDVEESDQVHE